MFDISKFEINNYTDQNYELPNNLNTYRSAVFTIKDLPKMNQEKGFVSKFLEPANTYLIDPVTTFLTDTTMKILSKIPIAADPISTERLSGIVQKIKSYSGYWAERKPTNFKVLHFADACTIGTARCIYIFSKDAELLLQVPENLRDFSDKIFIAVDEEIIRPLTDDGIELGRKIFCEGWYREDCAQAQLTIEEKNQESGQNNEIVLNDLDTELIIEEKNQESEQNNEIVLNDLDPELIIEEKNQKSEQSNEIVLNDLDPESKEKLVVEDQENQENRNEKAIVEINEHGPVQIKAPSTGPSIFSRAKKIVAGVAIAGTARVAGYVSSFTLGLVKDFASSKMKEAEKEVRMRVTALATKEILTTLYSTTIKGAIVTGTYFAADRLVTQVYPENDENKLFRNAVGLTMLTIAATGTAFGLNYIKYLSPSLRHLYNKGTEPFDSKSSTVKEVIEVAAKNEGVKQILEFVKNNYDSTTENRPYFKNFLERLKKEGLELPIVQNALFTENVSDIVEKETVIFINNLELEINEENEIGESKKEIKYESDESEIEINEENEIVESKKEIKYESGEWDQDSI